MLGYPITSVGLEECLAQVVRCIEGPQEHAKWLACINPHSYAVAKRRSKFASALKSADWLVPDGVGVVIASRLLHWGIRRRITGSDIFEGVNSLLDGREGGTVFFLGSTEQTLQSIERRFQQQYPSLCIVGSYSPPFKDEFDESDMRAMLNAVNAAKPDVLWVGMTAPKQEEFIHRALPFMHVKFAAAVGAVFDFYTGRVRRSSQVFQRTGLEWLPRLLQEPRRLWRRTFISAPVFMLDVVSHRPRRKDRTGAGPAAG